MAKSIKKNTIVTLAIIVSVIAGLVLVFTLLVNNETKPQYTSSSVNYSPPTEQEAQAGNDVKESQPDGTESKTPTENNSTGAKPETEVIISDSSQYGDEIEIRAFMPEVLQKGDCTVTLTKDSQTIQFTEPAYPDASSTICIAHTIPRDKFNYPGVWELNVTYNSDEYTGSANSMVEVK